MTTQLDDIRAVSLAERPELAETVPAILAEQWPRFMMEGRPGHRVDLTEFVTGCANHQVVLVGEADVVLGIGVSVPLHWDGTDGGLPTGWDAAVTAADAARRAGPAAPNTVCALSITMTPAGLGRSLAARVLGALKDAAAEAGADSVIVPVRPTLKARYPLIPMERYLSWRTAKGESFDPWVRLHERVGGRLAGIADPSMTISGTLAEWASWTELAFPDSGDYVIPGGLVPLRVDPGAETATYREPNVWVIHAVG